MELRINLAFVAVLGFVALWQRAESPQWVAPAHLGSDLVVAEDTYFRSDAAMTGTWAGAEQRRALMKAYVDANRPALAIAVARKTPQVSHRDPNVTYQLARAYAQLGRFEDAAQTARLALRRCETELDHGRRMLMPRPPCTVRTFVAIDTHARAMAKLVRWNVVDPDDARVDRAFASVQRTARLAKVDGGH